MAVKLRHLSSSSTSSRELDRIWRDKFVSHWRFSLGEMDGVPQSVACFLHRFLPIVAAATASGKVFSASPHHVQVLDPREGKGSLECVCFRLWLASDMGHFHFSAEQTLELLDNKLTAKCKMAASWCGKSWKVPGRYRGRPADWSVAGGA